MHTSHNTFVSSKGFLKNYSNAFTCYEKLRKLKAYMMLLLLSFTKTLYPFTLYKTLLCFSLTHYTYFDPNVINNPSPRAPLFKPSHPQTHMSFTSQVSCIFKIQHWFKFEVSKLQLHEPRVFHAKIEIGDKIHFCTKIGPKMSLVPCYFHLLSFNPMWCILSMQYKSTPAFLFSSLPKCPIKMYLLKPRHILLSPKHI